MVSLALHSAQRYPACGDAKVSSSSSSSECNQWEDSGRDSKDTDDVENKGPTDEIGKGEKKKTENRREAIKRMSRVGKSDINGDRKS